MRQKSGQLNSSSERLVKNIRRATRKQYSAEEKIRVVLDGLRGEHSDRGALPARRNCRESLLQLGRRSSWKPASDGFRAIRRRAATSSEVKDLRRQAQELKEVVAEQALELRLLKKSMIGDGGDEA